MEQRPIAKFVAPENETQIAPAVLLATGLILFGLIGGILIRILLFLIG